MKELESDNNADGSASVTPAIMGRKQFDTVILDPRYANRRPRGEIHGIGKMQASEVGWILAITAEDYGPKTLGLIERYLVVGLPAALVWLIGLRHQSRPPK
jgi:hypothetical protein